MLIYGPILVFSTQVIITESFQNFRVHTSVPDNKAISLRTLKNTEDNLSANAFHSIASLEQPSSPELEKFFRPVTLKTKTSGHDPSFKSTVDPVEVRLKPHHALRNKKLDVRAVDLGESLRKSLTYLTPAEHALLHRALAIALLVHEEAIGVPEGRKKVEQAVKLCKILGELEVDVDVLCAAMLSGTVTPARGELTVNHRDLERRFGSRISLLIQSYENVTHLEKLAQRHSLDGGYHYGSRNLDESSEQVDFVRNLILSEVSDWKVLVMILAAHIRKMRDFDVYEDQEILAREALSIYAPLAHRLGVHSYVSELQDRAFRKLLPFEYFDVKRQVVARISVFESVLNQAIADITLKLKSNVKFMNNVESVELTGRIKEPYSMWKKMSKQHVGVSEISDAVALRIILKPAASSNMTDEEADKLSADLCFEAMEMIHEMYPTVDGRFKNYISNPKPNGYKSLHTTALMKNKSSSEMHPFEIQIRTHRMHQQAEYGVAAHFSYKGEGSTEVLKNFDSCGGESGGCGSLSEFRDGSSFINWLSKELRSKKVFVFGPDGLIWDMEKSATAADIARLVSIKNFYSNVRGSSRVEIMVEGTQVPFDYLLRNGDCISVMSK